MKLLPVIALSLVSAFSSAATVTVFKSPTCACCKHWVKHMEEAGHDVNVHDNYDMEAIKRAAGVPEQARSCHTAAVEGYFLEGHVPAEMVDRLLTEQPTIKGLAVPGMPMSSPGMAAPGQSPSGFDVLSVSEDEISVFHGY